jgi:hypothetical protein
MGWWSWTAYYFGLNEGAALTNAQWEAEHLKSLGYNIFHIDEGYQYARGEYITPNATCFRKVSQYSSIRCVGSGWFRRSGLLPLKYRSAPGFMRIIRIGSSRMQKDSRSMPAQWRMTKISCSCWTLRIQVRRSICERLIPRW